VTIHYDETGDTVWTRKYDGRASGDDRGVALAAGHSGEVYVGGNSDGGSTGDDFLTLRYSPAGDLDWEMQYSHSGASGSSEVLSDIAVDDAGNVCITGMSALDFATVKYSEVSTAAEESEIGFPSRHELYQNYPNPFNPSTTFQFTIVDRQSTILSVYNLLGQEVTTLVNEIKNPGTYQVTWNAAGQASGVYYYRLSAGEFVETRQLMMVR
jgi:hypothetical protein